MFTNQGNPRRRTWAIGAALALPVVSVLGSTPSTAQDPVQALQPFVKVAAEDWDLDGISNSEEATLGTDPKSADTDGDGLSDQHERRGVGTMRQEYWGAEGHVPVHTVPTDPLKSDTDGDGVSDSEENQNNTWPTRADSDADGLSDGREIHELLGVGGKYRTNPLHKDTDLDDVGDAEEVSAGTDPNSPANPTPHSYSDVDGDGVSGSLEWYPYGTDYFKTDTDDDGAPDSVELFGDGNADWADYPANATNARQADSDGDGLKDGEEFAIGTNANAADSDGDGLSDAAEGYVTVSWHGTSAKVIVDPLNPDQNKNSVLDGQEISLDGLPRS